MSAIKLSSCKVKNPKKVTIELLKPTYLVANLLGVAPQYNFRLQRISSHKIYNCIIAIVIIVLYTIGIVYKTDEYRKMHSPTYTVTSFLAATLTMMCCLTLVLCGGVIYTQHFETMFVNFHLVDTLMVMETPNLKRRQRIQIYIEIIISFLCLIAQASYNLTVEIYQQNAVNISNLIRKPLLFVIMAACLLMRHLAAQFAVRYKYLNDKLQICNSDTFPTSKTSKIHLVHNYDEINDKQLVENKINDLEMIFWVYTKLHENMVVFNQIFGWQILFIAGYFVTNMLFSANALVVGLNMNIPMDGFMWGNHFFHILINIILCIPFAPMCNQVALEAKKTSLLCYVQLAYIKTLKTNKQVKTLNDEELTKWRNVLEELSGVPWPGFSAAGFFEVNNTMLFGLFGSLTSYLIVLIQLKDYGN